MDKVSDSAPEMKDAPGKCPVGKRTRGRVIFTTFQLAEMENVFLTDRYPDVIVLEKLSEKMNLKVDKIATWFQNRRAKFKRESKDSHKLWMRKQFFGARDGVLDNASKHVITPPPRKDLNLPTSNCHYLPSAMSAIGLQNEKSHYFPEQPSPCRMMPVTAHNPMVPQFYPYGNNPYLMHDNFNKMFPMNRKPEYTMIDNSKPEYNVTQNQKPDYGMECSRDVQNMNNFHSNQVHPSYGNTSSCENNYGQYPATNYRYQKTSDFSNTQFHDPSQALVIDI